MSELTLERIADYAEMLCPGAACSPHSCDGCKTPPDDGEECPQFTIATLLAALQGTDPDVSANETIVDKPQP